MTQKVLAIFGATGQQGGSVLEFVLQDPELSKTYSVRAITRDVSSEKSQALLAKHKSKTGFEVVSGDATDSESLVKALHNVHTVFLLTTPVFAEGGRQTEFENAKRIADAAVAQGARYIIFSTLPSFDKISGGKYPNIAHFEAKADAETYIRGLPIKSAFFAPAVFMQNFKSETFFAPTLEGDTWIFKRFWSQDLPQPYIEAVADTGKFVGAILASPEKYAGKTFAAATRQYTWREMVGIFARVSGKKVAYRQVSKEEYLDMIPQPMRYVYDEAFSTINEFGGMYGPETEEKIAWARENARGEVTEMEEYFTENPWEFWK